MGPTEPLPLPGVLIEVDTSVPVAIDAIVQQFACFVERP